MKVNEISQLIIIRDYVVNAINSFNFNKETARELVRMLTLLDKRIVENLLDENFKKFIGYQDAEKALAEVVSNNNIKKGMKPISD